jgi:hypothetical protein
MTEGYNSCYGYNSSYTGSKYVYNYSSRYSLYNQTYNYVYNYTYSFKYTNGSYEFDETIAYSYYTPRFNLVPGQTFQVQPVVSQCNGALPQGFSAGGLQVLFGDGSVKGVGGGVSPASWNAALTPQGNDTVGDLMD